MSTPQLISQECGRHNAALDQSRSRITRGATWRKARTIMITPSADMVHAKVMLSYASLAIPPNQPFHRMLCLGDEVGTAYSNAIEAILAHPELSKWEFICTYEHDSVVPSDGLLKLLDRMEECPQFDAISGTYWTKGESGVCQCWGTIDDPSGINFRPQPPPPPGQVREYAGLGMGFCLFRMRIFRDQKLPRPLFETKKGPNGCSTQDLTFWASARRCGYRGAVDANVLVGHIDTETGIVW